MAVPEQTPYKEYVGNGVTTNFALEFTCDSKQELKVFINDVEPELSTWSLAGGSVSFITAPTSGSKIVLKRATKLERTTNYLSSNNSFRPEAINKDFDRVWYAIQDQNYKVGQYDYDYNFVLTQVRPINSGGTGADNVVDARTNLELYSRSEIDALIATGGAGNVVGIAGGGTGATTAEQARNNLSVYSKTETNTAIANATPNELLYMPIAYPKSTPPTGYLVMMGQAISQETYPILYSLYGATLPDLRGQFLRGLDYGRGIDVGRTVLSEQQDEIKAHTHTTARAGTAPVPSEGAWTYRNAVNGQTDSTGGDETRPKNIAFLYIVKAG